VVEFEKKEGSGLVQGPKGRARIAVNWMGKGNRAPEEGRGAYRSWRLLFSSWGKSKMRPGGRKSEITEGVGKFLLTALVYRKEGALSAFRERR